MIKKIFIMVAVCCLALTARAETLPKETQNEIRKIISNSRVRISFEMSDVRVSDNKIILTVKGDDNFVDNATITIPQDKDLEESIEQALTFIKVNGFNTPKKRIAYLNCLKDGGVTFRHE